MKKKVCVLLLLCFVLVGIGGCQKGQEQKENRVTSTPMPTATPPAVLEDFSHIEKHLVWYHDKMIMMHTDPGVFNAFNRLLLERGYDFVVDFVTEPTLSEAQYQTYQKNLRMYKEQGKQIDLIFTGWAMDEEDKTYDTAIQDELLMPLDDYFREEEEGKRLYEAFSEQIWEMMRRDDKVYGVCENGWYGNYYSATLNRDVLERYEVDAPTEFSVEAYLETMGQVYEKAKKTGEMLPCVYLTPDAVYSCLGYYKVGDFFVRRTEGNEVAFVNPYEDEAVREVVKLLEEYRKVFGGYGTYEEYCAARRSGTVLGVFSTTWMDCSCSNRNTEYSAYTYEPQQMYYAMPMRNIVHGVASWATYPEEAKTLLTLISTDEEFINLLYYGVEGVNYRLVDGRVERSDDKDVLRAPGSHFFVNDSLVYPQLAEPDNKKEVLQEHRQEVIFLTLEAEELLKEPLSEEEKKVAELFRRAEGLWLGECENAEAVAEQISAELEAANVEEVLKKRTEKIYSKGE